MPRKRRILALVDPELVPPTSIDGVSDEEMADWKMEYDVCATLRDLGHEVECLGLEQIGQLAEAKQDFGPHLVFNMLEEFHGSALYEPFVVGHLELLKLAYTGCNPQGLLLAHDKSLTKKLLRAARIPTPRGVVFPRHASPPATHELDFPMLVKSTIEDASLGISLDSVVTNDAALREQVNRVHDEQASDALVEEFIAGREFYVGTLGNSRPSSLPVWELKFRRLPSEQPNIATADVKWDHALQEKLGVYTHRARISDQQAARLQKLARSVHRALGLSGYARVDFRLGRNGQPYVLEANPNPNLSYGEDFAESANCVGIDYESLLQKILNLGLRYTPAWR